MHSLWKGPHICPGGHSEVQKMHIFVSVQFFCGTTKTVLGLSCWDKCKSLYSSFFLFVWYLTAMAISKEVGILNRHQIF